MELEARLGRTFIPSTMGGDRRGSLGEKGREPGRKEGGKRESRGGRNQEKVRKFCNILSYFAIEMGHRGGNQYGKGREAEVKVTGRGIRRYGSFRPPCPSPLHSPYPLNACR